LYAWLLLAAITGAAMFATKMGDNYSRVWVAAWLIGGFVLTTAARVTIRLSLRALRTRGFNQRHVAIVGAGTLGRTVGMRLIGAPWTGFNVRSFYDDDTTKAGTTIADRPVLPIDERLRADVEANAIDQVWIALPLRAEGRIRGILTMLREHSVEIRFVPDIYSFHLLNHSMTDVGGLPVISLTETPMSGINRIVKAIEDYALASLLLVLASPFIAADRDRHQAHLARTRALSPGARDVERREVPDAQVPHHAGRCGSRQRSRVVAPRRAPRNPVRRLPPAHELGRIAAVLQRPARRDVARGPPSRTAGVRRAIPPGDTRLHAKAPGQGGDQRMGASERPPRG
jgi:hypothetical protein